MRTGREVSQVVVETTGTWIGAIKQFVNGSKLVCFGRRRGDGFKLPHEPGAACERSVQSIQICAARNRLCLVALDSKLHANALIESLTQFQNPSSQVLRDRRGGGFFQDLNSLAQNAPSLIFQVGLIDQSAAGVSVVISPVKGLLESPF